MPVGFSGFKGVATDDAESAGSDDAGSAGADLVSIEGRVAVFRGGGFAITVGRLLSLVELVRGTVGGLKGVDGEAFSAAEVLLSRPLT